MRRLTVAVLGAGIVALSFSCKSGDEASPSASTAADDPEAVSSEALERTRDSMKSFAAQPGLDTPSYGVLRKAFGHYRAGARAYASGRHGIAVAHALRARGLLRDPAGGVAPKSMRVSTLSVAPDTERERAMQRGEATALDAMATREEADAPSDADLVAIIGTTTLAAECERLGRSCNASCTPRTCSEAKANCGLVADGCGGLLRCGACTAPETCGGGGTPSRCGAGPGVCVPARSCTEAKAECGAAHDGCGGILLCGACPAGQACGTGAKPNRCAGCVPRSCAQQNATCGIVADGCGGTLSCGTCKAPETCGGGGTPNQCGGSANPGPTCVPKSCADFPNVNCGPVADGCGGLLSCGLCASPLTCGGGGVPSQCGGSCTPKTCDSLAAAAAGGPPACSASSPSALGCFCGLAADGCGSVIQCGTCPAPQTCGGGGTSGVCGGVAPAGGCVPKTCASLAAAAAGAPAVCSSTSPPAPGCFCGPAADGCGGLLDCGGCAVPQTCGAGGVNTCGG